MGTTTTFSPSGMGSGNTPPVAVVTPSEQTNALGSVMRLDGHASYDPDGDILTDYRWSMAEVPVGSTLTDDNIEVDPLDDAVITFVPDVTGLYRITLEVNDGIEWSSPTEALVQVNAVLAPVCSDIIPQASFIFRWVTDFLQLLDNKEVLPIVWSAFIQIWGGELLKLMQVDYNKSLANIQELFQRRWLAYHPYLSLNPAEHYIILGNQQDGEDAYTGNAGTSCQGLLIGPTDVIIVSGPVGQNFVGNTLEVLDSNGSNNGEYTIQKTRRGTKGYKLEADTQLPLYTDDVIVSGADLSTTEDSTTVTSLGSLFTTYVGFEAGDWINIEGYFYEVISIIDDNNLEIDRPMEATDTNLDFTVYNKVTLLVSSEGSVFTDVFYIPQTEGDLSELNSGEITGSATIVGLRNIVVGSSSTLEDAIGKVITVSGDENEGEFVIGDINPSGDGYMITGSFEGTFPQEEVSFSIQQVGSADGRVAIINGRSVTLTNSYNDDDQPDPPTGPGPISIATVDGQQLHANISGAEWRIPATLRSFQYDFDEEGVSPNDLIIGEIINTGPGCIGRVYGSVVAVDGPRLGFEVTRMDIEPGADLDLTDEEKVILADKLCVEGASLDLLGNLELESDSEAEEVADTYNSTGFGNAYFNIPLRHNFDIEVGPITVRVRVLGIIRNSKIPLHEDIVSIPCLAEHIVKPKVYEDDDGQQYIYHRDGSSTEIDIIPIKFKENREYVIEGDGTFGNTDGEMVADDTTFTSPSGYFFTRNVMPGDELEIEGGVNQGEYTIIGVIDESNLTVVHKTTGEAPLNDQDDAEWTVTRRVSGNFVQFAPGLFSPAFPAPRKLFAETTFYNNGPSIEDNFGTLVGLTQEQLSEQETRSTSYASAVKGLAYAWTFGPKVELARIGAQILLGMPVAEERGVFTEINDSYQTDPDTGEPTLGRALIEDLDPVTGEPTGTVRVYFYIPTGSEGSEEYTGISENPETGATYEVGDTIEKYFPVSNGVEVEDYINKPYWWRGKARQGDFSAELRKYHTWRLLMNVDVTDPRDMQLAAEFVKAIRPVWTDVEVMAFKLLVDEVVVEDDLYITAIMDLLDNPGMGLEASLVHEYFHHGVSLLDFGDSIKGTRILFRGDDLVTSAGSGTVTSDRGWFTGWDGADWRETIQPNAVFTGDVDATPYTPNTRLPNTRRLVRANGIVPGENADDRTVITGDILYIMDGPNRGRYEVVDVAADGVMTVDQLGTVPYSHPALPPRSPDPADMEDATGQMFVIERVVDGILDANLGSIGVGVSITGDQATFDAGAGQIVSSGFAVGDKLFVIDNQGFPGGEAPFTILDYSFDGLSTLTMKLDRAAAAPIVDEAWVIWRRILLKNPLMVGQVVAQSDWVAITSNVAHLTFIDPRKFGVEPGDWFRATSGPAEGREWKIIHVKYGQVCLANAPGAGTVLNGDDFEIIKKNSGGGTLTYGKVLDTLPYDIPEITLYDARQAFFGPVPDMLGIGDNIAQSAAIVPDWSAVLPPPAVQTMYLELPAGGGAVVTGVYEITDVPGGPTLEIISELDGVPWGPQVGTIFAHTADFNLTSPGMFAYTDINSIAAVNFNTLGVRPGDVVQLGLAPPPNAFTIEAVVLRVSAGGVITLTENLNVNGAYYGRIIRRRNE